MRFTGYFMLLVLTVVLANCDSNSNSDSNSDSETNTITIADFVGSWTASSVVFTNNVNSSESIDLIAIGGETRMTVLVGGGVRTWVDVGDFSDEWDATLSVSGNTVTSTPVESSRPVVQFTFTMNGNTLTLTDTSSEFDFTLTGAAEVAATQVIVFERK